MIGRRALGAVLLLLPVAARADSPAAPVAALNDALQGVGRARTQPFAERAATLAPVVDRAFALPVILRAVVGPRFVALPQDDQAALLDVFRQYTVASYVANFPLGPGDRIVADPQTRAVGADQVVSTHLIPASGPPTRLDYQVRPGASGWQIVDVLIDGSISQVAVQRSDFRSLLGGGSAAPLIASLRAKTASLSGQSG